jgi:hypothetical protein
MVTRTPKANAILTLGEAAVNLNSRWPPPGSCQEPPELSDFSPAHSPARGNLTVLPSMRPARAAG